MQRLKRLTPYFSGQRWAWGLAILATLIGAATEPAMPALLNLNNNGQSWVEHGITHDRVVARISAPIRAGCPELWAYMEARLTEANAAGWYGMG